MTKKLFITIFSFIFLLTIGATSVSASGATDNFGSCLNPKVKASHVNKGDRFGVVGTTKLYSGVDTIYKLTNGNIIQCLCQKDGRGIQTNWMKVGSLSKSKIETYKKDGWVYIITGSTWGLSDEPYLAKNIDYSCKGNGKQETKVKGLASTGYSVAIFGLVLAGFVALATGLMLRKVSK